VCSTRQHGTHLTHASWWVVCSPTLAALAQAMSHQGTLLSGAANAAYLKRSSFKAGSSRAWDTHAAAAPNPHHGHINRTPSTQAVHCTQAAHQCVGREGITLRSQATLSTAGKNVSKGLKHDVGRQGSTKPGTGGQLLQLWDVGRGAAPGCDEGDGSPPHGAGLLVGPPEASSSRNPGTLCSLATHIFFYLGPVCALCASSLHNPSNQHSIHTCIISALRTCAF
jgi:hypothetical protein